MDDTTLAARVHETLLARGETVATAESLTGGLLGGRLTATAGSSTTYVGGLVTYATELKQRFLGVSDEIVSAHGVVSAECARQMALGVRELLGTDWGLGTTGVAGPTLQEGKPPGTVHVAVAGPDGVRAEALSLEGDRALVREQTCAAVLGVLLDELGEA